MRDIPNVAIIGCGRMGQRRAKALGDTAKLYACYDPDDKAAWSLGTNAYETWQECVADKRVDIVIVCTPPNVAPEIAVAAASAGKHVLIEKPGAILWRDLDALDSIAKAKHVKVRVGFNLRCHPAISLAYGYVRANVIGDLMYIRAVYGHGGRLGMEKEWRCDPNISGGGELMDQGVHLIDLSRWFLGDLPEVWGRSIKCFWNPNVEDNAFLSLRSSNGPFAQFAQLHASWTEWKNTFRFEIFGQRGKLKIDGLGGSYGTERMTLYKMRPEMGPPDTTIREFPLADDSFEVEWAEFLRDIREDREPSPGIADAQAVLRIVEEVYGNR